MAGLNDAPLRVLLLAEALFVGGREEVILVEAKHLGRGRFEPLVAVLSDKQGPVAEELRRAGVEVVALGLPTHRLSLRVLRALGRLVREREVALIHAHDYKAALFARLLARGRLPVVYTVHYSYERARRKRSLVNRALARWTDAVIGVSEEACRSIARHDGLAPRLVRHLPNAVEPQRLEAGPGERELVRAELGVAPGDVLFLSVSRLEEQKGHSYLLEALARQHENCRAAIVGAGPREAALRGLAAGLGLDGRVTFTGMRRDLGRLLAAADCFVLPSLDESFGLVLAEAMYAGLPVIATRVGGVEGVVTHGEQGLLVPPADGAALGAALSRLAEDPELARRMGRAGRRRVEERFLPRHHIAGLEAIYDEALRGRTGARGEAR